jgi:hypothetical protein
VINLEVAYGLDLSLTHGSIVRVQEDGYAKPVFCYQEKSQYSIHNVKSSLTLNQLFEKTDTLALAIWINIPPQATLVIDFSPHTFFRARRTQTVFTSLYMGYLYRALTSYGYNVIIVPPEDIRAFAGFSKKTPKEDVINWYLTHTALSVNLNVESWLNNKHRDSEDAAILAWYYLNKDKQNIKLEE